MLHFFLLTKETVPLYLDKTQRDGPKQYNAAISKRPLPFSMDSGARGNHHSMHVEDGIISAHTCTHAHTPTHAPIYVQILSNIGALHLQIAAIDFYMRSLSSNLSQPWNSRTSQGSSAQVVFAYQMGQWVQEGICSSGPLHRDMDSKPTAP